MVSGEWFIRVMVLSAIPAACGCRAATYHSPITTHHSLLTTHSAVTYRDRTVEVWGRKGRALGEFIEPRAVVTDRAGHVYVSDSTGRIQKFTTDGKLVLQWRMPEITAGKPESLGLDANGNLLVPDTHYHRVLIYSPAGKLLRQWGKRGDEKQLTAQPGDFIFVNGMTATADGRVFATEYGGNFARVQEFTGDGEFVRAFSSYGAEEGQFRRPGGPCIALTPSPSPATRERGAGVRVLVICDQPNHRVQTFSLDGKLLHTFGKVGRGLGELSYPYGVTVDSSGNYYVAEWGNHRVQKFTKDWKPLGVWGKGGTKPGELYHPWGVAVDDHANVYVADHENNRVQKFHWTAG